MCITTNWINYAVKLYSWPFTFCNRFEGRCFNFGFLCSSFLILTVKTLWKLVHICQTHGKIISGLLFFWDTVYLLHYAAGAISCIQYRLIQFVMFQIMLVQVVFSSEQYVLQKCIYVMLNLCKMDFVILSVCSICMHHYVWCRTTKFGTFSHHGEVMVSPHSTAQGHNILQHPYITRVTDACSIIELCLCWLLS